MVDLASAHPLAAAFRDHSHGQAPCLRRLSRRLFRWRVLLSTARERTLVLKAKNNASHDELQLTAAAICHVSQNQYHTVDVYHIRYRTAHMKSDNLSLQLPTMLLMGMVRQG